MSARGVIKIDVRDPARKFLLSFFRAREGGGHLRSLMLFASPLPVAERSEPSYSSPIQGMRRLGVFFRLLQNSPSAATKR